MDKEKENVLKMAKENDVKFIRLWFTDILGILKGFAIAVDELEGALEEEIHTSEPSNPFLLQEHLPIHRR